MRWKLSSDSASTHIIILHTKESEVTPAFRRFLDDGVPERPNEHELSATELIGTPIHVLCELTRRVKRNIDQDMM